jgi:hypothetical protein
MTTPPTHPRRVRAKLIEVRATINLPNLGHDQIAIVDPSIPYVAMCLEHGYVVPTARKVRRKATR